MHIFILSLVSPEPQRPKSLILDNLPGLLGRVPGRGGLSPSGLPRSSEVSPASSGGRPKPPPGSSFVPEVEEIRVSPVISKRGALSVLDQREKVSEVMLAKTDPTPSTCVSPQVWKKRWVVVRRPYVFLFRDERDPCERGLINLAQAHTEYSVDQQQLARNTFRWRRCLTLRCDATLLS